MEELSREITACNAEIEQLQCVGDEIAETAKRFEAEMDKINQLRVAGKLKRCCSKFDMRCMRCAFARWRKVLAPRIEPIWADQIASVIASYEVKRAQELVGLGSYMARHKNQSTLLRMFHHWHRAATCANDK